MPIYTVHVPPGVSGEAARADGTVFVRDGFGWGAFLLGPLALLFLGLWRAVLAWCLAAAALLALAALFDLGFAPRLGLYGVLAGLAGLEAADARRRALARRGFIPAALVAAASRAAAERRFFCGDDALVEPLPARSGGARPVAGPKPVVGLFPPSGGRA